MLAIETTNLSRSFKGKPAVKSLNMRVPEGSIYRFIGQNGAGKSTTQKMICGLLHPDAGSIALYGKNGDASEIRSKIGVIIESPALFPGVTAYENMMMQALNLGVQNPDTTIQELLKLVGLSDSGKKSAKLFSLGMKQRLSRWIWKNISCQQWRGASMLNLIKMGLRRTFRTPLFYALLLGLGVLLGTFAMTGTIGENQSIAALIGPLTASGNMMAGMGTSMMLIFGAIYIVSIIGKDFSTQDLLKTF